MLNDVSIKPINNGETKQVVIIVHGLGDSAEGIITLGEAMRPALLETEFVACDAPFPCEFSPFGYQWFSANDWTSSVVLNGVKKAAPYLNDYIDHIMESRNLSADKIALLGFSQGTMISLYVAPRRKEQLACVLGYSGALIGGENLSYERKSAPPVFLAHGEQDEVVPFESMSRASQGLKNANINVSALACPNLGHSVDDNGLTQGILFLKKHFKI